MLHPDKLKCEKFCRCNLSRTSCCQRGKKESIKRREKNYILNGTFTNQCRMSALQCIPRETRDHFPLLCVLKSHYATTSLLAPLVFIVKYCCKKKPGNITVDYFPGCCATPAFWLLSLFFLSRITGVCFFQSFHISKALLYTNDSSRRAQNNIQSLCHVNTPYVSLHEIQPDVKRQLLHLASRGANAAMEIFRVGASLSPCLFLSLAGVNGASFCLVQHPCYFDVMATPLPDQ